MAVIMKVPTEDQLLVRSKHQSLQQEASPRQMRQVRPAVPDTLLQDRSRPPRLLLLLLGTKVDLVPHISDGPRGRQGGEREEPGKALVTLKPYPLERGARVMISASLVPI
jgi:hypothetical protein